MAKKPAQDLEASPTQGRRLSGAKANDKVAAALTEDPLWPERVKTMADIPASWMFALYAKKTKKSIPPAVIQ
eukprot:3065947-Pyramimonas_sp.AAC.1